MSSALMKARELNPMEIYFETAHIEVQLGILCYWLILKLKNEVIEEQIKEALKVIFRNIDILHLYIQKEIGRYWFYKMNEEKITDNLQLNLSNRSMLNVKPGVCYSSAFDIWLLLRRFFLLYH
ncbi:UNVERIFIED_CONTAM: hypothetical protein RMT77_016681 [Armadillidium vulgare]